MAIFLLGLRGNEQDLAVIRLTLPVGAAEGGGLDGGVRFFRNRGDFRGNS